MEPYHLLGIVPDHVTGKYIEAHASAELNSDSEARLFYDDVKEKLLHVNNWHQVAGIISAKFQLVDKNGNELDRIPQTGDLLKVNIPGPGSVDGDGFDWALIEELKEISDDQHQSVGFRVRPCANPFGDKDKIAHFYDDGSTSSFIITRDQKTITASIIDSNIKPNAEVDALVDKIRDVAVGLGAMAKFSEIQWQNLANGLVNSEEGKTT